MRGMYVNEKATPGMPSRKVRRDLRKYRRRNPDWVVFNELGKRWRYRRQLRRIFHRRAWRHIRYGREMVVLRRHRYNVLHVRKVKLCRGAAWVPNPARRLLLVRVVDLETNHVFTIAVTHWPNGAFNRRHMRTRRWRRRSWRRCEDRTRDELDAEVDAGHSVVLYGDLNKRRVRRLHPRARWLHNGGRIVKGLYVNTRRHDAAVFRRDADTWAVPDRRLHTDKPALGVDMTTTRRG